jgi:hypothetical protein
MVSVTLGMMGVVAMVTMMLLGLGCSAALHRTSRTNSWSGPNWRTGRKNWSSWARRQYRHTSAHWGQCAKTRTCTRTAITTRFAQHDVNVGTFPAFASAAPAPASKCWSLTAKDRTTIGLVRMMLQRLGFDLFTDQRFVFRQVRMVGETSRSMALSAVSVAFATIGMKLAVMMPLGFSFDFFHFVEDSPARLRGR